MELFHKRRPLPFELPLCLERRPMGPILGPRDGIPAENTTPCDCGGYGKADSDGSDRREDHGA
jgi:hypothetical protein